VNYRNTLGLLFCSLLFLLGFLLHGNLGLYINLSGLLIVCGGSLAATLLSFRLEQLVILYKVITSAYSTPVRKETEIVNLLIDLSIKSKAEGVLSLQENEQETTILFLRRALGCLVDGYEIDQIRDILNTEMYFFKLRREDSERVLRSIAEYFPAFGIIGSVVGLITMIGGIGDSSMLITAIPIALTSTLYGLIFANFFMLPFAALIRERTRQELLLQKMIMEGVISISSEMNSVILKTKLESFLTPSARRTAIIDYDKLRRRFNIQREEREEQENTTGKEEDS
jgi:chemotaxis protein MotA